MSRLWLLLLAFLTLAVDDPEDPPDDPPPEDAAAPPDDDADLGAIEDILDAPEPPRPKRTDPRDDPYVQRLERELAEARAARPAPAASPSQPDAQWQREEELLRNAESADENTRYWTRYKVETDRSMRAMKAEIQQTKTSSFDSADRAAFRQLELTKPKLYARYAERVEEAARTKFPGVAREIILKLLAGEDLVDGKIKPKAAVTKPAATEGTRVDRGRTPGARSDVRPRSSGSMSDREKRNERLRNRTI